MMVIPDIEDNAEVLVVYDRNVRSAAGKVCRGRKCHRMAVDAGEEAKSIGSVMRICRFLLRINAGRNAFLVAVGGGSVSDIVGLAAGIYKRGIRYGNVCTTLLSMVDAGIGGKTGVNLCGVKNAVGVFHRPEFTVNDFESLSTLPEREWRSGIAEMLKTFIIADAAAYEDAVRLFSGVRTLPDAAGSAELERLVGRAVGIKTDIVRRDPEEKGLRRVLNLGHTVGHALEWHQYCGESAGLTHGEAVAAGIVHIAGLSEKMGVAQRGTAAKIKADFAACGLPTEVPVGMEELQKAMRNDKKASDGGRCINEVLIRRIGEVEVRKLAIEEFFA